MAYTKEQLESFIAKDQEFIKDLNKSKEYLQEMLDQTSILYAALVDQLDIVGRLDYALQDSKHLIEVDFQYYINKINYYSNIDRIPFLSDVLNLELWGFGSESNSHRGKIILENDKYIEFIKKWASEIDDYRAVCGDQINNLLEERNKVNNAIGVCETHIEGFNNELRKLGDD